ncbi:MAG: 1-acyl-sn-glycerol-3-phosphate acyltransferase [Burkholderiales bacterium]|nr:1-acyl-sn-glycerol-3-phosphate acyltransferase [Burkholderiales bacterium]MDE2394141.1 1-acyl-sn-glycerol-3-phosphate acyltransferase [Burkholderiales bacterium]MDE2456750.1 1-acyl-sn-glycerol-3-phosphate acyltransferase [Burkholderiales bacterium]
MRLVWGLRSALFVLWLALTVVPWALAVLLISVFARGAPVYWSCVGWLRAAIFGARWICGVRYRVHGLENVPSAADAKSAVLLAPKHQSTWETFAYPTLMPHPLAYVFKRELLWIPFFGWAMARMDMIHIDRARRSEAWRRVAAQGKRLFAQGVWVIMFPEGTRTPRGGQGTYKSGASRLAIAAGVPIVPIAASSAKCWPRKSFLLRPGLIEVSIGKPIPTVGRNSEDLMREVEAWIEAEMRRLDPEAYAAAAAADPGS